MTSEALKVDPHGTHDLSKRERLLVAGFIPPWLDINDMCICLPVSATTVDNWVAQGILPAPRKRGGKLMWKWSEVDEKLTVGEVGATPDSQADRIRNGTRAAAADARPRH